MYNLLTEPLIRYKADSGELVTATLPQVYAALVADNVASFPALRPHQRHAWHAFLVQLGAMALHRAGKGSSDLPTDADEWVAMIRGLTPDWPKDEPWHLVVEDITKPALMQPPASSKDKEKEFKNTVATPDELDMLVTSKNHDLKVAVADEARIDDWVFALVSLQTMEGFGGAGNYGISRMNGGLGSRPAFSLAPRSPNPGSHIARDIRALLEHRQSILHNNPVYPSNSGVALLWLLPWDGAPSEALLHNTLELFYIEICRRIRLRVGEAGQVFAIRTSSKAARVGGKDLKGRTGDPWTPTNAKREGLPLTLGGGGFNYRRVSEYLNPEDWRLPELMRPTSSEQRSNDEMQLVARSMVRGQGKTEGYHERVVPICNGVQRAMLNRDGADELARISKSRIDQIRIVQRILSHAIQTYVARGDASNLSPEHRALARPWLDKHDAVIDRTFFEYLQEEFDKDDADTRDKIRHQWLLEVPIAQARDILRQAEDSLPCPSIYRYRARVAADGLFEGRLRTELSDHFRNQGDPE